MPPGNAGHLHGPRLFLRRHLTHRLSIALNLSGLGEDQVAINLRTEQPGDAYKASIPGSWCRRWTSVVPC